MSMNSSISIPKAITIFGVFTLYFYFLSISLFPLLKNNFNLNPSLYWFILGYFLFIPLFVYTVKMVKAEGHKSKTEIIQALGIQQLTMRDWLLIIISSLLIFLLTGLIFWVSIAMNEHHGWRMIETTPIFMEEMRPYSGWEKLYLFVWLPMFFFNIVGEEILWRGYIQRRMRAKYSWLICAILWACFHLPFGLDMIIMASPALLVIPYIFQKTKNTSIAIAIHGIYNGPIFVLISLGIITH